MDDSEGDRQPGGANMVEATTKESRSLHDRGGSPHSILNLRHPHPITHCTLNPKHTAPSTLKPCAF
jgi:hypothetical protein